MDCSPPGFSVHWILQARRLEWVAISNPRGSSQPGDGPCVSCLGRRVLYRLSYQESPLAPLVLSKALLPLTRHGWVTVQIPSFLDLQLHVCAASWKSVLRDSGPSSAFICWYGLKCILSNIHACWGLDLPKWWCLEMEPWEVIRIRWAHEQPSRGD